MTLRRVVKKISGQDIFVCQACNDCDIGACEDMDIPLSSLVQLILLDDEEALQCRTLWSDSVLEASRGACKRGLDLHAVIIALRGEAMRKAENNLLEAAFPAGDYGGSASERQENNQK